MKNKVTIAAMFIVAAVVICLVPFPVKIDRTMEGIRLENSEDRSFEDCSVTVEGWYYRYLLRDNTFKGDISFSVNGETCSYCAPNISLCRSPLYRGKMGPAAVYDAALNQMVILGDIVITGNFKEVLIRSSEWEIVSPAENYEEAVNLTEKLTIL